MKITSYEFSDSDLRAFYDVCYDALGKELNTEQLKKVFDILPETVRMTGIQWGLSDTVFRDYAYEWLEKSKELAGNLYDS